MSTSSTPSTSRTSSRVTREPDGETPDGTPAEIWRFANPGGVSLRVTTYGGIIMSLMAPDRDLREIKAAEAPADLGEVL